MPPALGDGSVVANGVFNITLADGWVPIASMWLAVGSLPLVASMLVLLAAVVPLGCKRFLSRREEREDRWWQCVCHVLGLDAIRHARRHVVFEVGRSSHFSFTDLQDPV